MVDTIICGVTATQFREHFETDMATEAIERLLTDACAAIDDRIGGEGAQVVHLRVFSSDQYLFLPREITVKTDITLITLRPVPSPMLDPSFLLEPMDLASDEWEWLGGRKLQRLVGEGEPTPTTWGWRFSVLGFLVPGAGGDMEFEAVVSYTPAPEERRVRVMIDLVKLAIQYNALKDETAGDYKMTAMDYAAERVALIDELHPPLRFA